jgi:ABC-type antimicrobial peptide transport system permease subunit
MVSQIAALVYIDVGVMMNASWQQYHQETNVGDVWIDTALISTTVFESASAQWQTHSINAIQPRLYFQGHITVQGEKVPVDVISLPAKKPATVNKIITTDESYFTDYSEIKNGVYLEQSYLEYLNLDQTDQIDLTIQVKSGSKDLNLTVLGGAYSPEYPMKPGPGSTQFESSASFDPYLTMSIFLRTDFLQNELFQNQTRYNSICISFERDNKNEISDFIRYLQTDQSLLSRYIIDVRDYPALIEDMVVIMVGVGWGVALFFLMLSMFLTYTVVNRFIDEQRPQIGVMKALGYSNKFIVRMNLSYGLILGFIGSVLGVIVGGLLGILLTDFALNSWLSFPYTVIYLPLGQLILMIFISVICSLLACYISARRITKISPQAAIRPAIAEREVTTFFVEKFIQRIFQIRLPASSKYSIRNVFTNPKRTITTIVSLLMAVALIGGVLTIITMVFSGSSLMFESENWDAQITLTHPKKFSEIQTDILAQIPNHKSVTLEPILIDSAKIKLSDIWTKITFTALPLTPSLKVLGDNFASNDSVMISPDLAQQFELVVGENYQLLGLNGTEQTISIQSILPQHHVSSFYIPISVGNLLSFGNDTNQLVNGILLSSSEQILTNDVELLNEISAVNFVILKSDLVEKTQIWYQQMTSIFIGLFFLVFIIAGIIIYVIMSIEISERKDDLIIMKAVGIQNRNIYLWALLEILIYSLLASIGYFIGYYVSIWYMDILQQLMQQPQGSADLSLTNYIISLFFGFAAATMGQFIALRYVLKQKIAVVTKEKMFG